MGALCLCSALMGACAQPTAPAVQDCSAAPTGASAGVRMVLSFRQPVAGGAPEVLQPLQLHSQACVRHVTSVSPSVHAYVFTGVADTGLLRQRLLAWPALQDAVPDAKARAH